MKVNKTSKTWFAIQRLLFKMTLDTYLHITGTVKPIVLYAFESWADCDKNSKT